MMKDTRADQVCHYPSNPAPNRGESKEKGEKGEGKGTNPLCECIESFTTSAQSTVFRKRLYESQPLVVKCGEAGKKNFVIFLRGFRESEEGMQVTDTRKSKPSCHYAANPYHQCSKYCAQRINEIDEKNCSSPEAMEELKW
ncbi:hypothetical protein HPP92_025920 [Vanilla planifolia]|uniref:Uncharacterized protein n=1 Tax=Vanilla planifolia TaxID=51239 RepID=A0A835PJA8_VANPL|nr:hypothetical protein HPP92_025920 [Vanilla planifolia]